jgi:hypothetical protein
MPLAQVIRFEERQSMGGLRRRPEQSECVVIRFPRHDALPALLMVADDDDRAPGRGRDPG